MKNIGNRKEFTGVVVSDKMEKTVIVLVDRLVKHDQYHKFIRKQAKYAAHDESDQCKTGDKVLISESRPLSKTKKWRVTKILTKAE